MGKKSTRKSREDIMLLSGMVLSLAKGETIDIDKYVSILKKYDLTITNNGEIGDNGE